MNVTLRSITIIIVSGMLLSCTQKQESSTPDTDGKRNSTELNTDSLTNQDSSVSFARYLAKLPATSLVKGSFAYHRSRFLEVDSLDIVITASYVFGSDSLELFLTEDASGMKYLKLTEYGAQHSQVFPAPEEIEFDHGYSVVFHHPEHGRILGGLKNSFLIGALGYKDQHLGFFSDWVKAIEKQHSESSL